MGSLNSLLSYTPLLSGAKPVSLLTLRSERGHEWLILAFSPAPQPLSTHHGHGLGGFGGWHLLDHSFGSSHSYLSKGDPTSPS